MSYVTNIILTGLYLDDKIDEINEWLGEYSLGSKFIDLNDNDCTKHPVVAGTKALETCMYVGAFNYFPLKEFITFMKELDVKDKDDTVQLFVQEQEQDKFYEVKL